MKRIKYEYLLWERNDGTEESPDIQQYFITKDFLYSEDSFAAAEREAYNGVYEIYDDGKTETEMQTPEQRIAELEEALDLLLTGVTE